MTKTIRCDVVSAHGEIFSGEVSMVFATGVAGELGISPRHAPLITQPVQYISPFICLRNLQIVHGKARLAGNGYFLGKSWNAEVGNLEASLRASHKMAICFVSTFCHSTTITAKPRLTAHHFVAHLNI